MACTSKSGVLPHFSRDALCFPETTRSFDDKILALLTTGPSVSYSTLYVKVVSQSLTQHPIQKIVPIEEFTNAKNDTGIYDILEVVPHLGRSESMVPGRSDWAEAILGLTQGLCFAGLHTTMHGTLKITGSVPNFQFASLRPQRIRFWSEA